MKTTRIAYILITLTLLALVASMYLIFSRSQQKSITMNDQTTQPTEKLTYQTLISNLSTQSEVVETDEEIEQPFFSTKGKLVTLRNEQIQVFEYLSADEAQKESQKINPDGYTMETTVIEWIEPPHFFKKDRVIALYLGSNQEILILLEEQLGKQFAGR